MGDLKTRIQRSIEIFNDGNVGLIDELYAPTFVNHTTSPDTLPTREGFKAWTKALRAAFPDIRYTNDDVIECGDRYVTRLTATGTMRGDFAGMPATGKHAIWTEIHIMRVTNEHVVEQWSLIQELGMLVQLGVIQAPGRTPVAV